MDAYLQFAQKMDAENELKLYKNEFMIEEGKIYLDGNSLGLMSIRAKNSLLETMNNWENHGIGGWTEVKNDWFTMSNRVAELSAKIVGAKPHEITIHSSTTVNMHLLLATFYKPSQKKYKILVDSLNFPSDRYAVESFILSKGLSIENTLLEVTSSDGRFIEESDIIDLMTDDVALVILPGVLYRSGQLFDIEKLTQAAHKKDILIGFDLSHSAGAVVHELHNHEVDFAFWCNYKYLNGGPGAPASLFIHERHLHLGPTLWGWFGNKSESQFDMSNAFEPSHGASAWQLGTPHIMSMATLEGALSMHAEIGMTKLRINSTQLTDFMIELIQDKLLCFGFKIGSPKSAEKRGGHVSLEHPDAIRISSAMKARGLIPDFRPPNIIRLAPVPLYISYTQVYKTILIILDIMEKKEHLNFENKRGTVA